MKIKQILLCMLLACFILPASAQNSWGIVGGGLFLNLCPGMHASAWAVMPEECMTFMLKTHGMYNHNYYLLMKNSDPRQDLVPILFSKFNLELPILASYNVALNNKWNLRINAGPYLSMLCLAGINPLITPMAMECILVWAGGIRIFQIILLMAEGPGFHWNPSISFTLSMVSVLFVRDLSGGVSVYRPV